MRDRPRRGRTPGGTFLEGFWFDLARTLQRLRRAAGLRPLRGDTGRTPFLEVLRFAIMLESVLGASSERLGTSWAVLGPLWDRLGAVLGHHGRKDGCKRGWIMRDNGLGLSRAVHGHRCRDFAAVC